MTDQQRNKIQQVIRDNVAKMQRFKDRALGEQNTKASLIEPMLEALGWDIRDPDEVHREFRSNSKDSPVDYSLSLMRKPRLFVEAKGLGEDLADRRWIAQILGYATVAGVEWCVLTDGNEYRFYNATVAVDADEKLFCRIRLSDDAADEVEKTLVLISRGNMEENLLEVLWNAHFVDRRVKQALRVMLDSSDKGLVRLIRRRVPKLTPKEIVQSLRRLNVQIDSPPTPLAASVPVRHATTTDQPPKRARRNAGKKATKTRRTWGNASLQDIISAGLLSPPVRLFKKYKGQRLEANLLPDGGVEFQGIKYDSCSTAAENARASVLGRRVNTNGWDFWQLAEPDGKKATLSEVRQRFIIAKNLQPES